MAEVKSREAKDFLGNTVNNVADKFSFDPTATAKTTGKVSDEDITKAYRMATDTAIGMAQEQATGGDYTERDLRELADSIFDSFGLENANGKKVKAVEVRGESIGESGMRSVNNAVDKFNRTLGDGLDWAFDNTIGNVVGLFNKGAGEAVKGAFSGQQAAIIPEIAEMLGLTAVNPVLGGSFAALRSAPSLADAFSGRDYLTGEDLSDLEQLASGTIGALGMLPGVGALGKTAKIGLSEVGRAAGAARTAAQTAGQSTPRWTNALGNISRGRQSNMSANQGRKFFSQKPAKATTRGEQAGEASDELQALAGADASLHGLNNLGTRLGAALPYRPSAKLVGNALGRGAIGVGANAVGQAQAGQPIDARELIASGLMSTLPLGARGIRNSIGVAPFMRGGRLGQVGGHMASGAQATALAGATQGNDLSDEQMNALMSKYTLEDLEQLLAGYR